MKVLDKLNIGSKNKKSFFDFRHDVNTTSQFGFCQPTLIQSVQPKSSFTIKTNSFVRLGVLPQPTFGRIKVKTDTVYVPMSEVYEAFDYMKNGQSYSTPNFSGIPYNADFILTGQLLNNMLLMSQTKSDNKPDAYTLSNLREIFSQFFVCDVEINYDPFLGSTNYEAYRASRSKFRSLSQIWNSLQEGDEKIHFLIFLYKLINEALLVSYDDNIPVDFRPVLGAKLGINNFSALVSSIVHVQRGAYSSQDVINLFGMFVTPDMARFVSSFKDDDVDVTAFVSATSQEFFDFCIELAKLPLSFDSAFLPNRTSENADFLIQYVPQKYIQSKALNDTPTSEFVSFLSAVQIPDNTLFGETLMMRLSFHLTPFGKNVMKIITAGEVTFGNFKSKIELSKFYAYYKAWFDLYNPGRNKNWKFTSCYKLIHYYYDFNKDMATINATTSANLTSIERDIRYHFRMFLTDLAMCYYYLDVDQFTVCTPTVLQSASPSVGGENLYGIGSIQFPVYNEGGTDVASFDSNRGYPYTSDTDELASFTVKMLERLYYMANKESVLASKIEDVMRVKYGVNIRSSRVLGRDSFDCDVSEVIASVNNEQTALGEYAGKGIGSSSTKEIKFEVGGNGQGYIIQMMSIVPLGGYVQGMKPAQLTRYDFYTEELDSLGMEAVGKDEILSRESLINVFHSQNQTFGFRPRYFGLKYKNNINNGGFAFRSERSQFLPYCLDRIFSEGNIAEDINSKVSNISHNTIGFVDYTLNQPVDVVPDEILRSLGLVQAYGNYDRIFNDQTGFIDNFIVHIVHDFKYYAPMKPISDSWDTFDKEVDDSSNSANHE